MIKHPINIILNNNYLKIKMNIINDEEKEQKPLKILHISFNQDYSCFSIGTEEGFRVYETNPLKNQYERKMDGGIKFTEMLYRTNILGLIGGGEYPKFNPKKLVIWDDYQNKMVSEIKFFSNLKNVKLKKDKIFAVCDKNIYVFDLKTFENLEIINTKENPKGIFGISNDSNKNIIAYLTKTDKDNINKHFVTIKNYDIEEQTEPILAQEDTITYISLNNDGSLLATANEKGTIIKVHSTINGTLLSEFYRGKDKADINYICFDKLNNFLAVTSDRGTIHIWSMAGAAEKLKDIEREKKKDIKKDDEEKNENKINENEINTNDIKEKDDKSENTIIQNLPRNKKVIFGKTEKSFAKIRINASKSVCTFLDNNILVVITNDGMYYQALIDIKNGGDCQIISQQSLNNLK
jgi:WD40 repeat protein